MISASYYYHRLVNKLDFNTKLKPQVREFPCYEYSISLLNLHFRLQDLLTKIGLSLHLIDCQIIIRNTIHESYSYSTHEML